MTKPWTKQWDRVAVLPWPGIDGAYLCVSARKKQLQNGWSDEHCEPNITFMYDAGDVVAEWDGEYGPLQLWYKCDPDYEHIAFEGAIPEKAHEHWFFPYVVGMGHWGQCIVTERGLPEAFMTGDYEHIFRTLEWWASDRGGEYPGRLDKQRAQS